MEDSNEVVKEVYRPTEKEFNVLAHNIAEICIRKCAVRRENFRPIGDLCYSKCYDTMLGIYRIGFEALSRASQNNIK